ncbi:deazapurine DNA modification protein DpdA family protein [Actinoplanes derwentensis]|uniref:Uncharacterized protein n=1 Tax=Actinoplanes derwentensis TaxID=113562 RepID=A0A1H2CUX4_9ACTN|nr:DUF6884 domain-containing protein [Actinoplanes derwentensis]GID81951.1 hypothetical protein Ade03nite_08750 [Actinoplanes derwentensis]SDT74174.1 hypothetical protein SAMN04489716_6900 [Actinoplanes derwentensis]
MSGPRTEVDLLRTVTAGTYPVHCRRHEVSGLEQDTATAADAISPVYGGITYVVPCGAQKRNRPARARDLYLGQMFHHTLVAAERAAAADTAESGSPARVLILSGRYGLVHPDQLLEPYEQRIDVPGAVSAATIAAQATAFGIGWRAEVYALLPKAYLARLDAALKPLDVYVQDVYEGCGSIFEQRRVNTFVRLPGAAAADTDTAGPGLLVWIGGDVSALWEGDRVLISYDRLRTVKTPPVATAAWVLDSGAYRHLEKNRTWTVSAARYAADIRRYAAEIGRLVWAAPQDWPASPRTLTATGLTEFEHQIRTTVSVIQLRAADTGVPILPVLTGATPAGYLRHLDMYRRAGVDLHAEPLVGVGALLGRPRAEAAAIVRLLHAAGLTRLHLFGGKGRLLETVGHLATSIDSSGWSDQARRREELCPHGLVKWERNCPQAAREWAARQAALAARAASAGQDADPWAGVLAELLPSLC